MPVHSNTSLTPFSSGTSGSGRGRSPCSAAACDARQLRADALPQTCCGATNNFRMSACGHTVRSPGRRLVVAAHEEVATHQMALRALVAPALLNAVDAVITHKRSLWRVRGPLFLHAHCDLAPSRRHGEQYGACMNARRRTQQTLCDRTTRTGRPCRHDTFRARFDLSNVWSNDCALLVRLLPLRSRPPLPV